jgi:two-component system KDP operon response regulator KdpE
VVTVTDSGPGIAPEERTLVSDRFSPGRARRDGGPRGSGLGLYVCRRLVEAHGGEIWVEPEDGRSAISFSLPAARQAPDARRAGSPSPAQAPNLVAGEPPGHGELILIVEDEPEFRELVELWVSRHGWRTAVAADGRDVIRRFEEEVPALVLLDLNLPGIDGWAVTEWIRSVGTTPVLMVTALGSERDVVRGLEAGADDYLTKPVRFPELVARIAAALRRAGISGAGARDEDAALEFDGLRIEPVTHRVTGDAGEVHLTPTEFRLLLTLVRRPDALVGHADLLRAVWGPTYGDETQLLRVTMRNLRAKLAAATPDRAFIATEYGLGYRFLPTR